MTVETETSGFSVRRDLGLPKFLVLDQNDFWPKTRPRFLFETLFKT